MTRLSIILTVFLALPGLLSAAGMEVVSKRPMGKTENTSPQIAAVFSRPAVALTSLSKAGENCPLRVFDTMTNEQIAGRCRWQGTQTAVFEPASPLRPSSAYRAEIKGGLASADGKNTLARDISWGFETPRQEVMEMLPSDGQRWVAEDAKFIIGFKYPVPMDSLGRFVSISETGTENKLDFSSRKATKEEFDSVWKYYDNVSTSTTIIIEPKGLRKGKKYTLSFHAGLPAEGASLGMEKESSAVFETIAPLELLASPNDTQCLPASPEFQFSNPVRYGDFVKNIKFTPEIAMEGTGSGSYDPEYDGATWLGENHAFLRIPSTSLKPRTKYTAVISGELSDIFGQKLGKDRTISFKTGDICPSVEAHSGFGVLESYYPARHPIEVVNAGKITVQKLALNKNNFIPFYKKGHNNLPEAAFASEWNPSEGLRNTKVYTYLDFSKVQEYKNAGFFYARLKMSDGGEYGNTETIWDNATDLGVTVKTSPDNVLLWVTRLKTGKPAAKVNVELRSGDNKVLWHGLTDKNGIAVAPGYAALGFKDWKRWDTPELWVFADSYQGTAVINSEWNDGIQPWRFNIPYEYSPSKETYGASLFSDRGIYRTGEKANIKGFLRKLGGGDWRLSGVKNVRVSFFDSRDNRVFSSIVPVNASSSFSSSLVIPQGAPSGVWKYSADEETTSADEATERLLHPWSSDAKKFHFEGDFRVEDYKPAVFEIKAVPLKKEIFLGDKFEGIADAKYLSGASLAGAKASWSVRLDQAPFEPAGWKDYSFESDEYEPFSGETISSGKGKLNSKGSIKTSVKLPKTMKGKRALRLTYEADITSPDGQNLFARGYAPVHRSGLYMGIKEYKRFAKAGEPKSISIAAVHPDGKPFVGRKIKIETIKTQWIGSRRAGLGGRLEWVNEKQETVLRTDVIVSGDKPADYSFVPETGGSYSFRISGVDDKNRASETVLTFYASGNGDAWWEQEDNDILEVSAEKETYTPGETARLSVKSPWDKAVALITVEREGVMDYFTQEIEAGASEIEIPVKDNYIPNAFVSVVLVQGRTAEPKCNKEKTECSDLGKPQGRFGYGQFAVRTESRILKTEITSDKNEYRPGDTVRLTIKTTDGKGNPVSAEAAVSVADEGVLSLTSWKTPDIFSSFYGPRPLYVKTADNRLHLIGQRSYGEKGEKRGGGGGLGVSGLDLRSNFQPSAYWNPSVKTNAEGKATVTFKVPDNLTKFRVSAVAAAGHRFGSGETAFSVSKPLMLRPILPSFARTGDSFACGALIQNFSPTTQSGEFSAKVSGAVEGGAVPGKFSIGSGAYKAVSTMCNASDKSGKATFIYEAKAKEEKDGLKQEMSVREHKNWEYNYVFGISDGKEPKTEKMEIPYSGADGEVSFEASSSIAEGLGGTEDYIMNYPYGMLDAKLAQAQILYAKGRTADSVALINQLSEYQTSGGGFSYWNGGSIPDPYLTASFIITASQVSNNSSFRFSAGLKKAKDWLLLWLRGDIQYSAMMYSETERNTAKAYATFALAKTGVSVKDRIAQLYASRNDMSIAGKAYLLRAMRAANYDRNASKVLSGEILSKQITTASTMYFSESEDMPWLHSSRANTTALVLSALLEVDGGFAGEEKAANWLAMERKTKDYWRTITENLSSWQALKAYSRKENANASRKITVSAGGSNVMSAVLDSKKKKASSAKPFTSLFEKGDKADVVLTQTGTGRTYYGYRMKFLAEPRTEPASEGFKIDRIVRPIDGKTLKSGGKALVTVTVSTPQDRMFVALTAPVPAGFEIVNSALSTSGNAAADLESAQWNSGFDHSEIYEDRLVLMADYLPAGEYSYTFMVQASAAGDFFVPSARVECVYEPEIFGEDAAYRQKIGN